MVIIKSREHTLCIIKVVCFLNLLLVTKTVENSNSIATTDCSPCRCRYVQRWPVMFCITNNDSDLVEGNYRAGARENTLYFLSSPHLNRIDENTFGNITFKDFNLRATVVDEFHLFSAFRGMQQTLSELAFFHVTVYQWTYSTGEEFHRLRRFELRSCPSSRPRWNEIYKILNTFPTNIRYVTIDRCHLESWDMSALKRFPNLTEIRLTHNNLQSVKRCHFPRPASQLVSFELSFNPITFLPDDMFQDMPALKKLRLDGLNLTTLHEHIFRPIFTQLNVFSIKDVPIACDCNATWLLTRSDSLETDRSYCRLQDSTFHPLNISFPLSIVDGNCSEVLDDNMIDNSEMADNTNLTEEEKDNLVVDYGGLINNVTENTV